MTLEERGIKKIIEQDGIVLCDKQSGPHRYVTWRIGRDGDTYSGHYFAELREAIADFMERIQ